VAENSLTFTISAESADELAVLMRRIAHAIDGAEGFSETNAEKVVEESGEPEADWYRINSPRFLDKLKPEARRALLYIARRSPTPATVAEVAAELGVEAGPKMAGRLASVGWAARVLNAPAPPYRRSRNVYEMDVAIAAAFTDVARKK
jgi:hypothetical protein